MERDRLSRRARALLGVASASPLAFFVAYFGFFVVLFIGQPDDDRLAGAMLAVLAVGLLTFLVVVGLLIFFFLHLFRTQAVRSDHKAVWAVLLLLATPLALPAYWYVYFWRGGRSADGAAGSSTPSE